MRVMMKAMTRMSLRQQPFLPLLLALEMMKMMSQSPQLFLLPLLALEMALEAAAQPPAA